MTGAKGSGQTTDSDAVLRKFRRTQNGSDDVVAARRNYVRRTFGRVMFADRKPHRFTVSGKQTSKL